MAALMTSMRLKQIIKLSKFVENKTCVLCLKPMNSENLLRTTIQDFSSKASETSADNQSESGGEEKTDDAKKSNLFKKYGMKFAAVSVLAFCAGGVYTSGAPDTDAEGQIVKDECSDYALPVAYMMRCYKRVNQEVKVTKEPSRERLLPDPLTYPYLQPKYTVVIEMTDVLVHPQWNFQTGWRFKKRPGIDVFLRAIGPPLFEVVVYTRESGMTADPIITKVDPENFIMYRLYRDSTRYENGVHIKDLRYLNRDLSKVIMIDWDKQAVQLTPENGFYLKKWTGENNDTALGELAEFLRDNRHNIMTRAGWLSASGAKRSEREKKWSMQPGSYLEALTGDDNCRVVRRVRFDPSENTGKAIAVSNVDDVRPVLQYYSQFDEPLAKFHENQIKLKEEQDRQARAIKQQTDKSLSGLSALWRKR